LKYGSRNLCESVKIRENPCYVNQFFEIKEDDLATKFIFVGESRIISKLTHVHDLNGGEYERINTYYHHTDHLGTSNVITDYTGAIYKEIYLSAYGEEWVNRGDTLRKITADFTGHPFDNETKLHYMKARYYDAMSSRFISVDPVLQGDNIYGYCGNNPLKFTDPSGMVYTYDNGKLIPGSDPDVNEQQQIINARYSYKQDTPHQKSVKTFFKAYNAFIKKYNDPERRIKNSSDPIDANNFTITAADYYYSDGKPDKRYPHRKQLMWAIDLAAAEDTKIYTVTDQDFNNDALKWQGDDDSWSNKELFGSTYNTQGDGYGYRIKAVSSEDNTIEFFYGHTKPGTEVANDLINLQSLAKSANIKSFFIPQGTHIANVGNTGLSTNFHLHYEVGRRRR
jgi:RHS repeat-associated protein